MRLSNLGQIFGLAADAIVAFMTRDVARWGSDWLKLDFAPPSMVSQVVHQLCRSHTSVSSELAKNPTEPPGQVVKRLFPKAGGPPVSWTDSVYNLVTSAPGSQSERNKPATPDGLKRALECGKWGETNPSDLFLKVGPPISTASGLLT